MSNTSCGTFFIPVAVQDEGYLDDAGRSLDRCLQKSAEVVKSCARCNSIILLALYKSESITTSAAIWHGSRALSLIGRPSYRAA